MRESERRSSFFFLRTSKFFTTFLSIEESFPLPRVSLSFLFTEREGAPARARETPCHTHPRSPKQNATMAPAALSRGRGGNRDNDGGDGPSFAPLTPAEERLYEGQPKGFPLGGFDLDDVMLPEGEDMGIASGDDDGGGDDEGPETGFGRVIGKEGKKRATSIDGRRERANDLRSSGTRFSLAMPLLILLIPPGQR